MRRTPICTLQLDIQHQRLDGLSLYDVSIQISMKTDFNHQHKTADVTNCG